MKTHTNTSIGWDCPLNYDDIHGERLTHIDDDQVQRAAVHVSESCNWFGEQDEALAVLCIAGDEYSIRQWGEAVTDRLPEIVRAGGEDPDDPDCIGWMNDVREAWESLYEAFD